MNLSFSPKKFPIDTKFLKYSIFFMQIMTFSSCFAADKTVPCGGPSSRLQNISNSLVSKKDPLSIQNTTKEKMLKEAEIEPQSAWVHLKKIENDLFHPKLARTRSCPSESKKNEIQMEDIENTSYTERVLLAGCGEIGGLFLNRFLKEETLEEIWVVQPSLSKKEKYDDSRVHFVKNLNELDENFKPNLVFLAFRPQDLSASLPEYKRFNDALFVTPVASVPIHHYKNILGKETSIVRLMPNIAEEGLGTTLFCTNEENLNVTRFISDLLNPLGMIYGCSDETEFNQISTMTGSGIAYFLKFTVSIKQQLVEFGVLEHVARQMATRLLLGSANLVRSNPEESFEVLISKVATEGGITECAIKPLGENLPLIMKEVKDEWLKRSEEISKIIEEKSSGSEETNERDE